MNSVLTQAAMVGTGGFLGALLRYGVGGWIHRKLPMASFPVGTLTVNLAGCLAIGLLAGAAESRQLLSPELRLFLLIGLLGGFTTFSTFGFETVAMLRDGEALRASINVALHVIAGLALVWLGYALTAD